MRYVPVPDPLVIINPFTGEPAARSEKDDTPDDPLVMHKFTIMFIVADGNMPKGAEGLMMAERLMQAFKGVPSTVDGMRVYVPIESSDWSSARDILKTPANTWNQVMAGQMRKFKDAWTEAKEEKPKAGEGVVWGEPAPKKEEEPAPASA